MLFWKWGCLVGSENSIFRKLKSVDPKKMPLTTEIDLHFYFPFKAFPKNERERERVRAREEKRRTRSRRWSQSRLREIMPARDPRGRSVEEDREIREEDPSIAISWRQDRAVDRDLTFARSRRREIQEEEFELCLSFFWVVACVFLDLCFPFSFPNTRKYFLENFLKCNQTQRNIFPFRKLAFPENMYFLENILRQPNTALFQYKKIKTCPSLLCKGLN